MTNSRLTLKSYKHYPEMSDETDACSGTICVDGIPAVGFKNSGCGGPNEYWPIGADNSRYREFQKMALEWGTETGETFEVEDALVYSLIEEKEDLKKVKRFAKKTGSVAVFTAVNGTELSLYPIKIWNDNRVPALIEHITKETGTNNIRAYKANGDLLVDVKSGVGVGTPILVS